MGTNGVAYASVAACAVNGYVLGQLAAVLKTSDGGATWTGQTPGSVPGLTDYFSEPGGSSDQPAAPSFACGIGNWCSST